MVRRRLPRGLVLTLSLVALALGLPGSAGAARDGLIAYSVDEGEQTCDQCGPQGESLPFPGGAWVETVRPDGTVAFGIYLTDLGGRTRLLDKADTLSVTWSRQGSLAWASPPRFPRWPDIWVGKPDGSERRRIARRGDTPAWSPDGRSVAFICRRAARGLCVAPASGGGARFITSRCTFGWDDYTGIAWSPDGREIACEGRRGGLIAVNLGTGAVRAIVRPRWMSASIQEIDWQPIP